MYVDVPKGVRSLAQSGANPFRPVEVLAKLMEIAKGAGL